MSARARLSDPVTSHEAADTIADRGATSRHAVFEVLRDALMPLTDEEIIGYLKGRFSPSRVRTARSELEKKGLVQFAGMVKPPGKRTRCRVWIAKVDAA